MKRMFVILALMVVASIMIAGCVQPGGNQTVTPAPTTPAVTETPMETETPLATETPMETETTPMETVTTEETETTATTTEETETTATTATTAEETETPPLPPVGEEGAISITASGFDPDTLTVPADTTVTWTNDADTNQTITLTGPTGAAGLGTLEPGDSVNYIFTESGNYAYVSEETGLSGTITVT
jgi:plastocyanin